MRALPLHLPIVAMALALGACGGDDAAEQAKGGAVSQNAVERELAEAPQMRPGLYRSRMEMVRFDVPGVPAEQQALMRGMMLSCFASSAATTAGGILAPVMKPLIIAGLKKN